VTLEGTNITSTGKTSLEATNGNVNINAATSTQDDQSYAAALGVKNTKDTGGTSENKYSGGVNVNVNETKTQTGATLNAGSLSITSGKDTNMTGTSVDTSGDTTLNAGGNVNLAAAESTYGGANLNFSVIQAKNPLSSKGGSTAIPLPQSAGVKGGVDNQGVNLDVGGDLNISSGGTTTMQSTQADVDGAANIDAEGGLNKTSTTSGGVDVGFKLSTNPTGTDDINEPSTTGTTITAKGATNVNNNAPLNGQQIQTISTGLAGAVASAPAALQTNLAKILNNASLTTAEKFKQMGDAINNDPTLSSEDKTKMLAALAKQQQDLGGQQ